MAEGKPKSRKGQENDRRKAFVEHYLACRFNGTEAARRAGYACPSEEAHRLLKNAQVRARIDERLAALRLSADEVLAELRDVAMCDPAERAIRLYGEEGNAFGVEFPIRGADKVKALELLGKAHALFTDKIDLRGEVSFADLHALAAAEPEPGAGDPRPGEG